MFVLWPLVTLGGWTAGPGSRDHFTNEETASGSKAGPRPPPAMADHRCELGTGPGACPHVALLCPQCWSPRETWHCTRALWWPSWWWWQCSWLWEWWCTGATAATSTPTSRTPPPPSLGASTQSTSRLQDPVRTWGARVAGWLGTWGVHGSDQSSGCPPPPRAFPELAQSCLRQVAIEPLAAGRLGGTGGRLAGPGQVRPSPPPLQATLSCCTPRCRPT